jgi:hypothetical protein
VRLLVSVPLTVILASMAASAQAQLVATPYLGMTLAGDAEFRRGGPGGSVGYFGGWIGFEFDALRHHHFFKDENVDLIPNNCAPGVAPPCIDLNTDAWSFMGSVVAFLPSKGTRWRPYGAAGFGAIHPWIEGPGDQYDIGQTDPAFNVGGGVIYSLNRRAGIRGDLRYFRAFVDEDRHEGGYFRDYGFLRATFGVTFGFPGLSSSRVRP